MRAEKANLGDAMSTDVGGRSKANNFALQDKIFGYSTQFFALLVLVTLVGIIAALVMGSWQTLTQTGPKCIAKVVD